MKESIKGKQSIIDVVEYERKEFKRKRVHLIARIFAHYAYYYCIYGEEEYFDGC